MNRLEVELRIVFEVTVVPNRLELKVNCAMNQSGATTSAALNSIGAPSCCWRRQTQGSAGNTAPLASASAVPASSANELRTRLSSNTYNNRTPLSQFKQYRCQPCRLCGSRAAR